MKCVALFFLLLFLIYDFSAFAEPHYILPDGWYYNADDQIVAPNGDTYDSIWDDECLTRLQMYDWGYGDVGGMKTIEIPNREDEEKKSSNPIWGLLVIAAVVCVTHIGKKVR